jgi:Putative polyhydroxyalkanoic acid system protein (PHA_gran_rgn)
MTTETPEPEPRYERFCLAYPPGTVVFGRSTRTARPWDEVRVTHPMAIVESLSTRGYFFTSYSAACYSAFMNQPIKSIKIAIPHRLSRQEATRRLQSGFADFRTQYASNLAQMEDRWTGDHMDFKATAFGQLITGRIDVRDSSVDVEVDLPWLFAVLAEKVKGQLQQAGQKLLEKK